MAVFATHAARTATGAAVAWLTTVGATVAAAAGAVGAAGLVGAAGATAVVGAAGGAVGAGAAVGDTEVATGVHAAASAAQPNMTLPRRNSRRDVRGISNLPPRLA